MTLAGRGLGQRLAARKRALEIGFALVVVAAGCFVVARGFAAFG